MRSLLFNTLASLVFATSLGAAHAQQVIVVQIDLPESIPEQTTLAFPAPIYWVKYSNTHSYVLDRGKSEQELTTYDGLLLYGRRPKDGFVPFQGDRFFKEDDLTTEVRNSALWQGNVLADDVPGSLWEAIERGAGSKNYPAVTNAILQDMLRNEIVWEGDLRSMTKERVTWALAAYTKLAFKTAIADSWEKGAKDPDGSLWATIESILWSPPGMTYSIIWQMEMDGIITREQREGTVPMTSEEITSALLAFAPTVRSPEFKFK